MAVDIEKRLIDVAGLQLGMFACRPDRPWGETPLPLQGTALTRLPYIGASQGLCCEVHIDVRRWSRAGSTRWSVNTTLRHVAGLPPSQDLRFAINYSPRPPSQPSGSIRIGANARHSIR